mgnify:CR=1 FL=1
MNKNLAIVLAAGKGTRMKSNILKPLHKINKNTIIYTLVEKLYKSQLFNKILVVVGLDRNNIVKDLKDFESKIIFITQKEQLGTGDALKCCKNYLINYKSYRSLILFADCPLLNIDTMKLILEKQGDCIAAITQKDIPFGNGRIIINQKGIIINAIEEKDCNEEQKKINLVNVGIYLIQNNLIINHIDKIKNDNNQKEYYLPDLMLILIKLNYNVIPIKLENTTEFININTQEDLKKAHNYIK